MAPRTTAGSLSLPHERDQGVGQTAAAPDPVIEQAKRDLDACRVDTDLHAAPGSDAAQLDRLVPKRKLEKAPSQAKPEAACGAIDENANAGTPALQPCYGAGSPPRSSASAGTNSCDAPMHYKPSAGD